MTGNHNSDSADKARDNADKCTCGGYLKEIDWCILDDEGCFTDCEANISGMPCYKAITKFECKKCGAIYKGE